MGLVVLVLCHFDQRKGLLQTLKSLPLQGFALAVQTISKWVV